MSKIIIAIDGYSSCGKSTTAKAVARQLHYRYIDSGAMYRAVTWFFLQEHVSLTNPKEINKALEAIVLSFRKNTDSGQNQIYLNGINVETQIRGMAISDQVSEVSAIPAVRHAMVAQQQHMGRSKGIVMDGRDIGTVVFPKAELKLFMTADLNVRAQRRQKELIDNREIVDLEIIVENLKKRDYIDTHRAEGPLKAASDAIHIDTTFLTLDEQVEMIIRMADKYMFEFHRSKA